MPYWRLFYHLVWATRQRLPVIDAEREGVLRKSIGMTCSTAGVHLHAMEFMPDHVHLVVSVPPRIALSDFVHSLKGASSHLVNTDARASGQLERFGWQAEYGVVSFGERPLPSVIAYVENQAAHHAAVSLRPTLEYTDRREEAPAPIPSSPGRAS